MNMTRLLASSALALAVSGPHAGVMFDPDGAGPASAIDLLAMDWGPTSTVMVGGASASTAFRESGGTCPASSCNFTALSHARLIGTTNQLSQPNTPAGLNLNYQITMVESLQEVVTGFFRSTATVATTGEATLQIYFDTALNANDLTGSGFNDGRLILQGTSDQLGRVGLFSFASPTVTPSTFDQFGVNDYRSGDMGQLTGVSLGSQDSIAIGNLIQDFAFFQTQLATFDFTYANNAYGTPFDAVQPSDCFTNNIILGAVGSTRSQPQPCAAIHSAGPYVAQAPDPNGGYLPVPGLINWIFLGGTDVVFQTDYIATVVPAQVPEPGSLALLGLALGVLGLGGFDRRRAKLD